MRSAASHPEHAIIRIKPRQGTISLRVSPQSMLKLSRKIYLSDHAPGPLGVPDNFLTNLSEGFPSMDRRLPGGPNDRKCGRRVEALHTSKYHFQQSTP